MVVVVVVVMILIGHIVYRTVPIHAVPVVPVVPVVPGMLIMILISVMVNIIVTVLKSLSLSLFLACAINYCLDCSGDGDCTRCRNGTLLKTTSHPHHCIGNHSHTFYRTYILCFDAKTANFNVCGIYFCYSAGMECIDTTKTINWWNE